MSPMPKTFYATIPSSTAVASGGPRSDQCASGDQAELELPFRSQHRLMAYLQRYLEGVCYEFGRQTMLGVLEKHGWDCAEAAQLGSWMDEFIQRAIIFEDDIEKEAAVDLFRSVANIQRVVVSRVRTDSAGIRKFLLDAVRLTQVLGVGDGHMVMGQFSTEVERILDNMREDEDLARSQLRIRLLQLQRQREVIDVHEKLALSEMDKDLDECQSKAGTQVLKETKKAEKNRFIESDDE